MISRGRVIAFGDVNVDLVVDLPGNLDVDHPEAALFSGGTVGNTAAGMARLGMDVSFLGKVGDDGYGRFIRDEFKKEGVDTGWLLVDKDDFTLMVIAFIDQKGEKHNITWPPEGTAQFKLDESDFPEGVWDNVSWFHTSGIILGESPSQQTTLKMMQKARQKGIPVSFDLNLRLEYFGWRKGVRDAVLKAIALSDYIFASLDEELAPLTGETDHRKIISALMHPGLTIIARQGKEDSLVFITNDSFNVPTINVEVVDTLGAGDAFNSGFILGKIEGKSLLESIEIAHCCAGFNLTRKGARGLPDRIELNALLKEYYKR
ncbi:MAG: sugar kinase [Spirochaetales bacterium]|nr:sugar kinase [Spirochaetales bacterium]